jgi:hypothetical protein
MKGVFDWKTTPIAPLGTTAMIYIVSNVQHTFISHCNKAVVTGIVLHHYPLLKLCVLTTYRYCILG